MAENNQRTSARRKGLALFDSIREDMNMKHVPIILLGVFLVGCGQAPSPKDKAVPMRPGAVNVEAPSQPPPNPYKNYCGSIHSAAFSPDGKLLLTGEAQSYSPNPELMGKGVPSNNRND